MIYSGSAQCFQLICKPCAHPPYLKTWLQIRVSRLRASKKRVREMSRFDTFTDGPGGLQRPMLAQTAGRPPDGKGCFRPCKAQTRLWMAWADREYAARAALQTT